MEKKIDLLLLFFLSLSFSYFFLFPFPFSLFPFPFSLFSFPSPPPTASEMGASLEDEDDVKTFSMYITHPTSSGGSKKRRGDQGTVKVRRKRGKGGIGALFLFVLFVFVLGEAANHQYTHIQNRDQKWKFLFLWS